MNVKDNRLPGLDIIRSLAIFFVIGGHFFYLNTNYRDVLFKGINMFFQGMCASLFLVAVPLFLLLTGFLNANKKLTLTYYKGIIRILSAYLIYSVITILYRVIVNGEQESVWGWIQRVMNYTAIPYGWYIELYIGLFLLIPFLNILYNHLETLRERTILVITFLILTACPSLFNRNGYYIFPATFTCLFPVTFYFIGAYIHEYKFKFSKLKLMFMLFVLCAIEPMVNCYLGNTFRTLLGGRDSLFYTAIAVIVFLLFYDVDFKSRLVTKISLLSLDIYLCSWIFDNLYYTYFKAHYFESQQQFFVFFPIIVPLVFFSSFGVAWLREKVNWGIKKIL